MEVMALPNKETLIFLNEIDDWIESEELIGNKTRFTFQKDTPKRVIDLFEEIKPKLDFVY